MKKMPLVAILIVGLMLIAIVPSGVMAYTPRPVKAPIEPNPMLEGNITFANHTSAQAPLQYVNQYGKQANLSAGFDPRVPNPVTIVPTGIIAPGTLQNDTVGGVKWYATSNWAANGNALAAGAVESITKVIENGQQAIKVSCNASGAGAGPAGYWLSINLSALPSANLAFDYITASLSFTGAVSSSSYYGFIAFGNSSSDYVGGQPNEQLSLPVNISTAESPSTMSYSASNSLIAGQTEYLTVPLSLLNGTLVNLLTSKSTELKIFIGMSLSTGPSADIFTTTLTGLALTTFPLTLGTTVWHTKNGYNSIDQVVFVPHVNLTALSPSFSYAFITSNSYTASIAQSASMLPESDVSITQAALSSGTYVEQLTYSFMLGMPAAPSLSYGAFKLADFVTLAPAQYVSVNYAGTSYLSDYTATNAMGNYTTLVSAASPTTAASWVGTVQYTQAQWNSISSPPGMFTVAGINYLWFVLIGVVAGLVGLGSAWASKGESASRIRGRGR